MIVAYKIRCIIINIVLIKRGGAGTGSPLPKCWFPVPVPSGERGGDENPSYIWVWGVGMVSPPRTGPIDIPTSKHNSKKIEKERSVQNFFMIFGILFQS